MKTDSQLQADVMAELDWEPAVNAAQIGVEVNGGIVTLAGEVGSYSEKLVAEAAAQRVYGVRALVVTMKVKVPDIGIRTDSDIARAAEKNLLWISALSKAPIKVMVEQGWITLTGHVAWQYLRQDAASCVRYLGGVTGVSNDIAVKPVTSASAVKADIEAALKRTAAEDARAINVSVKDTEVTLTGTVHSWSERELARRSAWRGPGVSMVVDKMVLAD